jgi:hypothetical protein
LSMRSPMGEGGRWIFWPVPAEMVADLRGEGVGSDGLVSGDLGDLANADWVCENRVLKAGRVGLALLRERRRKSELLRSC